MMRDKLLEKTIEVVSQLPDEKLAEVLHFSEFILSRLDHSIISEGMAELGSKSSSFKFLEDEESLYKVEDLKEK